MCLKIKLVIQPDATPAAAAVMTHTVFLSATSPKNVVKKYKNKFDAA